jgi:hypothetical protein
MFCIKKRKEKKMGRHSKVGLIDDSKLTLSWEVEIKYALGWLALMSTPIEVFLFPSTIWKFLFSLKVSLYGWSLLIRF